MFLESSHRLVNRLAFFKLQFLKTFHDLELSVGDGIHKSTCTRLAACIG